MMYGEEIEVEYLASPLKSENDRKEYRTLKLKNGLIALLISDIRLNEPTKSSNYNLIDSKTVQVDSEENYMASCGLCINVGSFNDPTEVQGMAHLLEHVTSAEIEKLLREINGHLLADTGRERTIFAFQVYPCHLLSAIDRIARSLMNSSVDESIILKERENIDNEFYLDFPSDCERIKQLFRVTMHDGNPSAKFSCGNAITLREQISDDKLCSKLVEFKKKYYSAHRITLVVQAQLSLHTLEQFVRKSFSAFSSNFLPLNDFSISNNALLFDTTKFLKIYRTKSISHTNQMEMKWILPPSRHLYRSKPLSYISRIMNHEGRGSLSQYLKQRNLCISLDVTCEQTSIYSVLKLSLVLRPSGKVSIQEILDAVFSFIKMMSNRGPQKRIFDELQKSASDKFRFSEGDITLKNVQDLCWSMQLYPPTDYITGNDLYLEYEPDTVKQFVDCLSCDNVFILLLDEDFDEDEFDQIESWYRIRYSSENICKDWIERWRIIESLSEFHLPEINPFIATDFQLVHLPEDRVEYPRKILDDGKIEIWYKPDQNHPLPLCFIYVHLIAAFSLRTIQSCVMLHLFSVTIRQLVSTYLYDAKCASLNSDISESRDGIIVRVNGFSQKVPILFKILMKHIGECTTLITEHLFDLMKTKLLKFYSSVLLDPVALASEIQTTILDPNYRTSRQKIDALNRINYTRFLDFLNAFGSNVHVRSLVQGNTTRTDAIRIIQESIRPLKCASLIPKSVEVCNYQLPPGDTHYRVKNLNPHDLNTVVLNFYQTDVSHSEVPNYSPILRQFLEMLIQEQSFRQLRIEEQLSYDVSCFECPGGFAIILCTPTFKFTAEYIEERIDDCLKRFINFAKEMSSKEFNEKKDYFVKRLKKGIECLQHEADRNWFAIDSRNLIFKEDEQHVSTIHNLKIQEFSKWIDDYFIKGINGKAFRKLSVQVIGNYLNG